jgi:hypothetical protein
MKNSLLLLTFCLAILVSAVAEGPSANRKVDSDFVHQQFGDDFTMLPEIPVVFGDLDGDGIEDVVIAARCKNPLLSQADHSYTVVDPYYDYFGFGDPKVTTTFSEPDPARRGLVVLIIHGAGEDTWRSATPKAKFVVVNLPYKSITVRKMRLNKKKNVEAVYVEEASEMEGSSALFFDGKKFRYVPMGGSMQ